MISKLIMEMCAYDAGDVKRIEHFLKVYAYAKTIGGLEKLPADLQFILESAAVLHDIGIRRSMEKYKSDAGNYQQIEGPPIAEEILNELNYDEAQRDRICYLIAHHHDYDGTDGLDYQILLEADLLVNFAEGNLPINSPLKDKVFKTKSGLALFDTLFGAPQ